MERMELSQEPESIDQVYLRRTELSDAPGIGMLVENDTDELFGDLSLVSVM